MANMSYCRFRNTEMDAQDCINALEERNISSEDEKVAAKDLLISILDFCEEEGIIKGYNTTKIEQLIAECTEQDDE